MSMTWTEEPWPRTSLRVFSEILYKLHLTGRSSRTGYARETFQRHTAVHFVHPVSQKSRDGSPTAIVGLRLTSTDRAVYRHRFIDRKSTSFPLNCRVFSFRSRWIFTRSPPSNLLEEIGEPISAMMLLNRITDAARCSCRSRGLHGKVVVRVPFGFTLDRAKPIAYRATNARDRNAHESRDSHLVKRTLFYGFSILFSLSNVCAGGNNF